MEDKNNINLNYKEITKKHMEMMNLPYQETSSAITEVSIAKPYFFDFNTKEDEDDLDYNKIYINYQISNSKLYIILDIIKIKLKIHKRLENFYGNFYTNWKEFKTSENNLYYFNEKLNTSTWENPIFIFLSLIDNSIDPRLVPINLETYDEKTIKVTFHNMEVKLLSKESRVIY